MDKKRFDGFIRGDLHDYIREEAERTGKPMNFIIDDLLEHAIAAKRGQLVEEQSLPIIRDIVQSELRKANAQLHAELVEDLDEILLKGIKELTDKQNNRLAALLVRAARDGIMNRRMVYALCAQSVSPEFARIVYEDAKEKTGKELARRDDE